MDQPDKYQKIADLFRYPDENLTTNARSFLELSGTIPQDEINELQKFVTALENSTVKQQQEYYMKTFHVQAICYLDIGYMMFGEDYKRAQLLVNLQNEHKIAGVDCKNELADHLPNVLTLLSKTTNMEFSEELGFIITMPAVKFMFSRFNNTDNYYRSLFKVLLSFLNNDFTGERLMEFSFAEEKFSVKNEFLMPSPKMTVCNSNCKQKKY